MLAITACNNNSPTNPESDNNNSNTPPALPNVAPLTISFPQGAPNDIQAMIFAANSLTGLGAVYMNALANSQPTYSNGKWTWIYNKDSLTITLTAVSNPDETVSWELILDGTETLTNTVFSNWTAMAGTTSKDGSSGSWVIYFANSTQVAGNAEWQIDSQGDVTARLTTGDLIIEAQGSQDGSGAVTITQNGEKLFESTWTATGGTWTYYNPETGETQTGAW
jgi:hypothetical protein